MLIFKGQQNSKLGNSNNFALGADSSEESICGRYTDSPSVLLKQTKASFESCAFVNINTGREVLFLYFVFSFC
jgi:hypothetical protein